MPLNSTLHSLGVMVICVLSDAAPDTDLSVWLLPQAVNNAAMAAKRIIFLFIVINRLLYDT
jgi:hypothetical protein